MMNIFYVRGEFFLSCLKFLDLKNSIFFLVVLIFKWQIWINCLVFKLVAQTYFFYSRQLENTVKKLFGLTN